MTAREFVLDYALNHPHNKTAKGENYYSNLEEFFKENGYDYEWSEVISSSRWWNNLFVVQEINGKLIGYEWAETTGDMGPMDAGWQFDEDSICFVEQYDVTVTKYKKILWQISF